MKFRTRFDESLKQPVMCTEEEKRTKSEFADECDINKIMARYRRTGELPESARIAAARFGDFASLPSFMEMQDKILAANELFAPLPAAVRKQFGNDPVEFVDAASTPEGREILVKFGLGSEAPESSPKGDPAPAGGVPAKKKWKGSPPPADAYERLSAEYDLPPLQSESPTKEGK